MRVARLVCAGLAVCMRCCCRGVGRVHVSYFWKGGGESCLAWPTRLYRHFPTRPDRELRPAPKPWTLNNAPSCRCRALCPAMHHHPAAAVLPLRLPLPCNAGFFVARPASEAASGAKQRQLAAGCSLPAFWASQWLSDMAAQGVTALVRACAACHCACGIAWRGIASEGCLNGPQTQPPA